MESANADQIRQVLYARSRREEKMVDAMVAMAAAIKRLKTTSTEAFGQAGAAELIGDTAALTNEQKTQLQSATETVSGEVATVTIQGTNTAPVVLQRIAGEWRIPISELAKGITPQEFDQRLAALLSQSSILNRTADQIIANRFHTGQEAAEWMHRQMLLTASGAVTTAPATVPAVPSH